MREEKRQQETNLNTAPKPEEGNEKGLGALGWAVISLCRKPKPPIGDQLAHPTGRVKVDSKFQSQEQGKSGRQEGSGWEEWGKLGLQESNWPSILHCLPKPRSFAWWQWGPSRDNTSVGEVAGPQQALHCHHDHCCYCNSVVQEMLRSKQNS